MIRKLRIRFVALAMSALFVFLLLITLGINGLSFHSMLRETDEILSLISRHKGSFPDMDQPQQYMPRGLSPETPYESRYFSVLFSEDGSVLSTDTSRVTAVDETDAETYARKALAGKKDHGILGNYRYIRVSENGHLRISFLDFGRKLEMYKRFLWISVIMMVGGLLIAFLVILFFSGKIIRPIAESYNKQKRFITDAGHEIKTPLAIINANADVLEMEMGEENESVQEIRQQTRRLTSLTNDLVALSRMEEAERSLPKVDFPLSDLVEETAKPFGTLAKTGQKAFSLSVAPMLTMHGDEEAIRRLTSILLDNALKYSPQNGDVRLTLERSGKAARLCVYNTTQTPVEIGELPQVFDRFYRMDASRNSETGGHGIGLSMAKAIVAAHGGKISASSEDGKSFRITAVLPLS